MKIFDMAIDLELNGEQFYRSLAEDSKSPGLKRMFNMLADDETKHKKMFEKMQEDGDIEIEDTLILEESNSIFKDLKKSDIVNEEKQVKVYKKALELENKSIEYYGELMGLVENEKGKAALQKVIGEEKKHRRLLEFIIEHVSRPETWVEDAEFYIREEY